jgi:hypothetical protein
VFVGAGIGIWRMLKDNNIAYGLVLVWAYSGILYKHLSVSGFDGEYPNIVISVIACIGLFVLGIVYLLFNKRGKK